MRAVLEWPEATRKLFCARDEGCSVRTSHCRTADPRLSPPYVAAPIPAACGISSSGMSSKLA